MFFFHGFSINLLHVKGGYGYGVLRHFQQYFSYIVAVSFIYLMSQIFYSVNIKYLYKLIDKSDKICNLKLK
jgi:purine-cytosine permease-like protein